MFNNKIKQENERLKSQVSDLQEELVTSNNKLYSLQQEYNNLKSEYNKIDQDKIKSLFDEYNKKTSELKSINEQIEDHNVKLQIESYGLFDLPNDVKYYKSELESIRKQQKNMLLTDKYYTYQPWSINGNSSEGNRLIRFITKTCITSFNLYCDSIMDKINLSNKLTIIEKIKKTYNTLNSNLKKFEINLVYEYLDLKIKEAEIMTNVSIKVQQDKDEVKRQKEIIREQELAERELNKEKERLEKELLKLENQQLKGDNSDILNQSIEKVKKELDVNEYRIENTLSGYVYFIVNKSFNDDCYIKIGCTRRSEAQIRIDELNCASVPFKFFALGAVFTDEAFKLEHKIHQRLNSYRVNKANIRKEFFKINPHELESILNKEFNLDVNFDYNLDDLEWKYSQNNS